VSASPAVSQCAAPAWRRHRHTMAYPRSWWVCAAAVVGWVAAAAGQAPSAGTTRLTMKDKAAWAFSGGQWKDASPNNATGSRPWLQAPSGAAADGKVAVFTQHAFADCNVTLNFTLGSWPWTTAALVVGARNLSGGYFVVDVPTEGQQFRSENTFVTVSRVNSRGWREGLAFIGPVGGVSSLMNMLHSLRVEVSAGQVKLWIDRTPLGTVALPGLASPSHVGLATYSMLGTGEGGQFDDVIVEGTPVAPQFDSGPKPEHNWIITNSSDGSLMGTDSIGNAIVLADGSILALNTALYRSVDKGKSWAVLSLSATNGGSADVSVGGAISGGRLYLANDSSVSYIGLEPRPPDARGPANMVRMVSTDNGRSFGTVETVGRVTIPSSLGAPSSEFAVGGFDTLVSLSSAPGTVVLCGSTSTKSASVNVASCPSDLSGKPPPEGCSTLYLGVSPSASKPVIGMNFCMRSTDSGKSFAGPVDMDGYAGVVGKTTGIENKDVCEVAIAETAEGDLIGVIRPCYAHSPTSWVTRSRDGGKSFTPLSRGFFPNCKSQ
jgi:hypothetical protein